MLASLTVYALLAMILFMAVVALLLALVIVAQVIAPTRQLVAKTHAGVRDILLTCPPTRALARSASGDLRTRAQRDIDAQFIAIVAGYHREA